MISCWQAINCAITAADKAQTLADLNPIRDDLVIAYSNLSRAWSSICDQLAILSSYETDEQTIDGLRDLIRTRGTPSGVPEPTWKAFLEANRRIRKTDTLQCSWCHEPREALHADHCPLAPLEQVLRLGQEPAHLCAANEQLREIIAHHRDGALSDQELWSVVDGRPDVAAQRSQEVPQDELLHSQGDRRA